MFVDLIPFFSPVSIQAFNARITAKNHFVCLRILNIIVQFHTYITFTTIRRINFAFSLSCLFVILFGDIHGGKPAFFSKAFASLVVLCALCMCVCLWMHIAHEKYACILMVKCNTIHIFVVFGTVIFFCSLKSFHIKIKDILAIPRCLPVHLSPFVCVCVVCSFNSTDSSL